MSAKRVVVAMSGGVDSSVAAAILKDRGYQVIGVTMQIWPAENHRPGGCCGLGAIEEARKVAYKLGIRHYVMNFRDAFARMVIDDFCREYSRGRTPNPCIRCNQHIKFDLLLNRARELDADFIATGHYARIVTSPGGYRLLKAVDPAKDQSYFLYTLGQAQLRQLLLPVGDLHKVEVRRLAATLGLSNAGRSDSQDICFIPTSGYHSFIAGRISSQPGDIVDTDGKVLGEHRGLAYYTVGQRRGMGLASNGRLYVLRLDTEHNRLVAGSSDQLLTGRLFVSHLSWASGEPPQRAGGITARVRSRATEVAVKKLRINNGTAEVQFAEPQQAVAPGQAVVFYRGEVVLGGGIAEGPEFGPGGKRDKQVSDAVLC